MSSVTIVFDLVVEIVDFFAIRYLTQYHKLDAVYQGGENLLPRNFKATQKNKKWGWDITSIHTVADDWIYLASIRDLATHKIIGWHYSKTVEPAWAMAALDQGVTT